MEERRRHPSPTSPKGYLDHLPASQLLKRLPTAILGIGLLGDIAYANPACAEMFGYVDGRTVTRLYLPELMTGHEASEPLTASTHYEPPHRPLTGITVRAT
jgi:PAS domain-containing protein